MTWPERWWDLADWWTDPRLAYARGLHDGYAAGRADRGAEDDQVHREAVQRALRIIDQADHRAAADGLALDTGTQGQIGPGTGTRTDLAEPDNRRRHAA